jgi:tripartite-type tricarboxylate transporter receptor subunit TctC
MAKSTIMSLAAAALLVGGIVSTATPSFAQDYPNRPITMVIPFAAGGPTDVQGRILAQRMGEILGQQVIVENVGGAGGMTGSARVANAPPDGYVFVLGTVGTHAQGQTLYKRPLYNALTDFTPVALLIEVPIAIITRKDLPVNNLKEFIDYSKKNEAKMSFGSAGTGAATHLACVVANMVMGTNIVHVPYRGTGPAMQDLQGGRIDFICEIISTAKPQIDGGTVKAIAIMTPDRSPVLPSLPTAEEQGVKGMDGYTWNAIFLPKGAPAAVVKKLQEASVQAVETPAVKERLSALGASVVAKERQSPEYLAQFVKSEIEKWAAPIKQSGASAD